jgi:hypothetical protein
MVNEPPKASEIIEQILQEIAPSRAALLKEIVALEEVHLSDRGTTTANLVSALIERAAKAGSDPGADP